MLPGFSVHKNVVGFSVFFESFFCLVLRKITTTLQSNRVKDTVEFIIFI